MSHDLITIRDLSYKYPAAKNYSLRGINLRIPRGSFYTLVGPSGSGKSTLLLLARGFYQEIGGSFQGKILVEDKDVNQSSISELGKTMGIVFQNPALQLHQLRVIDEVASAPMYQGLPYDDCYKIAGELVDRVLGRDFYYRSPQELSSGQQQMVALAASLALNADILLLDEPFSFLDETARHNLLSFLVQLNKEGKNIVMATHDIGLVSSVTTHMALLDKGQLRLEGSTADVLYSPGFPKVLPPPLFVEVAKNRRLKTRPLSWNEIITNLPTGKTSKYIDQRPTTEIALSLQNVTFCYPGTRNGVDRVCLDVRRGEILGLIGHNGSGKTTLAKIIMGLLKPGEGKIFLGGKDITQLPVYERAKQIGYSTQDPLDMFFEANLWDEVAAGPKLLGLPQPKTLAEVALKQYLLWHYKDENPDSLSGGEKSKLGLADITVSRQQLLLLDEPEFGLDPKSWSEITDYFTLLRKQGTTIVVITQDLEVALFLCDRLALVSGGQVVRIDRTPKILGSEKLLQKAGIRPPAFYPLLKKFSSRPDRQSFLNLFSKSL